MRVHERPACEAESGDQPPLRRRSGRLRVAPPALLGSLSGWTGGVKVTAGWDEADRMVQLTVNSRSVPSTCTPR